ncbi:hypothetical protein [Rhizobium oryzicola]|uniref:Uncharacterized protein n=1 Tax=Rhizobium oryzicola TaxID=1232668 RepID=A0ABT8SR16_9HYPH|nr:hypothetical protein [Rhizobium oryzicola]MDO1580877.1 hypothetical protein [Rhizobium oryzicola]
MSELRIDRGNIIRTHPDTSRKRALRVEFGKAQSASAAPPTIPSA